MSFFDEGEEPRTARAPRPRRPAPGTRAPGVNEQTLMVRRVLSAGAGILVFILIALLIKSCVDSSHRHSLESYNSNVSSIASEASSQVSGPLLSALAGTQGHSPLDVEVEINQYRVVADSEASRAQGLNVPGEMAGAQRNLLLALNLRAEALAKIADNIRTALGSQGAATAIDRIAGEMEVLLASDVVYAQRVVPLITQGLTGAGIQGQTIASSHFIPDLGWLSSQVLASRLLGHSIAGPSGAVQPGRHGHALLSVAVGSQTLTPGTSVNNITITPNLAFDLKVQNGGQYNESGVVVTVQIQGAGTPISVSKTIDTTIAGQTTDVLVPLTQTPPVGTPVRITANIAAVPGEKVLSNNSLSFLATFAH